MPNTAEQLRTAYALAVHLDTFLDAACDDPRGPRCQLDDLARALYEAGEKSAHDEIRALRPLGNAVWRVVDELDRLRSDACAARVGLGLALDDIDQATAGEDAARAELVAAGLRRED